MHDPTYPDVRDMPDDVLASAIVLADMLLRPSTHWGMPTQKADVERRAKEMREEWDRREGVTSYGSPQSFIG